MQSFKNITELLNKISYDVSSNYQNITTYGEVSKIIQHEKYNTAFIELKDHKSSMDTQISLYRYNCDLSIGDKIEIAGSMIARNSRIRFKIDNYQAQGIGNEMKKRENALKTLKQKGYLEDSYKKKITKDYPKIGIITSSKAAGCEDFIDTLKKRKNKIQIRIYDTAVQGRRATKEIARTIQTANNDKWADILIITRGGGSRDDLSCFDELEVALAIGESIIPIVCAVGHERDYCLSDEVADKSFITPTAAAEGITTNDKEDIDKLEKLKYTIQNGIYNKLKSIYKDIEMKNHIITNNFVLQQKNNLEDLLVRLKMTVTGELKNTYSKIQIYNEKLENNHLLQQMSVLKEKLNNNHNKIQNKNNSITDKLLLHTDININKINNTFATTLLNTHNNIITSDDDLFTELKKNNKFCIYLKGIPVFIKIELDE